MEVTHCYCLDTCFLVDSQRELKKKGGPALDFLDRNREAGFFVSAVAWGGFAAGRTAENERDLRQIRTALEILAVTEAVAEAYAILERELRSGGKLILTNDLWIAATAVAANMPLVTRNRRDLGRIGALTIVEY